MAEPTRRVTLPEPKPRFPSVKRVGQRFAPQDDVYHFILSLPWWQYLLLVVGAFLLVNVFFAGVYALLPGSIAHAAPGSIEDGFYFSVQTLATIGYGGMYPLTRIAHMVVTFEALVGMLFVAVITGLTYARFARPTARVLFSEKMCVTPRNGVPHLCIRMANWRNNSIVEASLTAMVLINEVTLEGEQMRRPVTLPLVRDKSSVFILSWTAMHPITESSPLYGDDALERLRAANAEFFFNLTGLDETISQTVHARYSYALDDIVWNARFADVVSALPDGSRQIDYTLFHDTVPLDPKPSKP